jgi:ferredoxin
MNSINCIYFSPTKTTETIVNALAENLGATTIRQVNLTKPDFAPDSKSPDANTISIIGMPVYSGRLPLDAVVRFLNIDGKGSKAVIIVVYGNREFDDALLELTELAQKTNFKIIGAAAFIGEHSYSTPAKPVAANRPDVDDMLKVARFAHLIRHKLETLSKDCPVVPEQIPGNRPFVERKQRPALAPETQSTACTLCGICAASCPTGAIHIENGVFTNTKQCIWCCACVKQCPEQARTFNHGTIRAIRENLYNNCSQRKEPQFFL